MNYFEFYCETFSIAKSSGNTSGKNQSRINAVKNGGIKQGGSKGRGKAVDTKPDVELGNADPSNETKKKKTKSFKKIKLKRFRKDKV